MPKNIVVCCDGTGKQLGRHETNVAKLYRLLDRRPGRQVAFYDAGVGTAAPPPAAPGAPSPGRVDRLRGLAFGRGLRENVHEAYRRVAQAYEDGDRIYLFGFSRGAFTVRALAGLIYRCGLLIKPSDAAVGAAVRLHWNDANGEAIGEFEEAFAPRRPMIEFLGVWDTVKSVGYLNPVCLRYTRHNRAVRAVRHALALGERRSFFQVTSWGWVPSTLEGEAQDVKEVWFAGVHSDVGGGYAEQESGLALICLAWMVSEALGHGLLIDAAVAAEMDLWSASTRQVTDLIEHSSLSPGWWPIEFMPRVDLRNPEDPNQRPTRHLAVGPTGMRDPHDQKKYPRGVCVHRSVRERMGRGQPPPSNLKLEKCTWEPPA